MPKENKHSRGRRGQGKEKRKREEGEEDVVDYSSSKRQKALDLGNVQFVKEGNAEPDQNEAFGLAMSQVEGEGLDRPFYGLLSDEEQEYFRHADELLELNNFPSSEDRSFFLANVFKEAENKELKIANSQSCSRLMERLILLSTVEQKKMLFQKFSGHFFHLIQHRFASHCCETLFLQSAPVVTEELTADFSPANASETQTNQEDVHVSMENLFLYTLNELEGHMSYLITDKFASHTLRVLLAVLSGKDLDNAAMKSLLQSKRKEQIEVAGMHASAESLSLGNRPVPESFQNAVDKIISDIAAGLDPTSINVLVTHPSGNPALQLLVALELTRTGGKKNALADENSILHKLLPDDVTAENSQSATFINGLIYDPVGSRLLEAILTFAPGKLFKKIYHHFFKERIGSFARNEIASYVVIKVLKRLSPENLEEAVTSILPQISGLVERSRTTIIKALLESCSERRAFKSLKVLTSSVAEAYGSEPTTLISKMTHTNTDLITNPDPDEGLIKAQESRQDPYSLHGSLLAQTMLNIPGASRTLIQDSLLVLPPSIIQHLACTTLTSHILQTALQPTYDDLPSMNSNQSNSTNNTSFRRKFTNLILSSTPSMIIPLATSKAGSHVIDALFLGTNGLMSLKERICTELANALPTLKEDYVARAVLRNWMVELFVRRRVEWVQKVKAAEAAATATADAALRSGRDIGNNKARRKEEMNTMDPQDNIGGAPRGFKGSSASNKKSAIDLARERFAAGKNGRNSARPHGKVST